MNVIRQKFLYPMSTMKIAQYDIARNQWKIAKNWSFVYSGLAQIFGINDHLTDVF